MAVVSSWGGKDLEEAIAEAEAHLRSKQLPDDEAYVQGAKDRLADLKAMRAPENKAVPSAPEDKAVTTAETKPRRRRKTKAPAPPPAGPDEAGGS